MKLRVLLNSALGSLCLASRFVRFTSSVDEPQDFL